MHWTAAAVWIVHLIN